MAFLIAFLGALLAGSINTLSGNGSALTLNIRMALLGLPARRAPRKAIRKAIGG